MLLLKIGIYYPNVSQIDTLRFLKSSQRTSVSMFWRSLSC
jgi:hypothetical protein